MTVFGKGAVQAWCNVSGDSNPPSLRDDYNVASITDHDTGYHSAVFDYDMPNANYAATIGAATGNDLAFVGIDSNYMAVGSCRWITRISRTSNATDFPLTLFTAIGDGHYGT